MPERFLKIKIARKGSYITYTQLMVSFLMLINCQDETYGMFSLQGCLCDEAGD